MRDNSVAIHLVVETIDAQAVVFNAINAIIVALWMNINSLGAIENKDDPPILAPNKLPRNEF
jgi:hypothetical protein